MPTFPNVRPMRLSRRPKPFDSVDWLLELKIDGSRSLAFVEAGECRLVSRNGNVFGGFNDLAQWIGQDLRVERAVLDGEVACVDGFGRSVFNDLLFRRGECLFFAFDLLCLNGEDLRNLRLIERKSRLKRLLRRKASRILYVDHVESQGRALFQKVCELDMEGIVAKRKESLIGRLRSRRSIGSRSRIQTTRRLRAGMNCSKDANSVG